MAPVGVRVIDGPGAAEAGFAAEFEHGLQIVGWVAATGVVGHHFKIGAGCVGQREREAAAAGGVIWPVAGIGLCGGQTRKLTRKAGHGFRVFLHPAVILKEECDAAGLRIFAELAVAGDEVLPLRSFGGGERPQSARAEDGGGIDPELVLVQRATTGGGVVSVEG